MIAPAARIRQILRADLTAAMRERRREDSALIRNGRAVNTAERLEGGTHRITMHLA